MRTIGMALITIVAMTALVAITLSTAWRHDERGADHGALLDDAVGRGSSWKAVCPSMDGGTDASCLINVDGGAAYTGATDITVTSTSTTCARFGFDTAVDQNHGVPVGTGCAAGPLYPTHATSCRCQSTGAAVVVDVTAARP